jgi:hypothetical protein
LAAGPIIAHVSADQSTKEDPVKKNALFVAAFVLALALAVMGAHLVWGDSANAAKQRTNHIVWGD